MPTGKAQKLKFHSLSDAQTFAKCIFTRNEFGAVIQSCFELLDKRCSGRLSSPAVKQGLINEGFLASDEQIKLMLSLQGANGSMSFDDFFKLFLDVHVYTIKDCLQEWLLQATVSPTDIQQVFTGNISFKVVLFTSELSFHSQDNINILFFT